MVKAVNEQKDFEWKENYYKGPTKVCFHKTMSKAAYRPVQEYWEIRLANGK